MWYTLFRPADACGQLFGARRGRKVSTPKQLGEALMENHLLNTTALLVKLDFKAPYRSAVVPSVSGISDFYAAQYGTTVDKEKSSNFTTVWGRRYKQCHLMLR